MSFKYWADSKIKKLNWLDIVFVKFSCIVFGMMLVILTPSLTEINVLWFVVIFIILGIKPGYKAFIKNR